MPVSGKGYREGEEKRREGRRGEEREETKGQKREWERLDQIGSGSGVLVLHRDFVDAYACM